MPYKIVKRNRKYSVVKKTSKGTKTLHSYSKRKDAIRYMRALYVNTKHK